LERLEVAHKELLGIAVSLQVYSKNSGAIYYKTVICKSLDECMRRVIMRWVFESERYLMVKEMQMPFGLVIRSVDLNLISVNFNSTGMWTSTRSSEICCTPSRSRGTLLWNPHKGRLEQQGQRNG